MLGTITFIDEFNKEARCSISGVTDITALETLAMGFQAYSHAVPRQVYVSDLREEGEPGEGPYESVEQKASLNFRNRAEPDIKKQKVTMRLPAPGESIFEGVDDKGLRVDDTVGEDIASVLQSVKAGSDITFVNGHMKTDKMLKVI